MKTFEQILDGRKLHELSDAEIDELVEKMRPDELEKFEASIKKESRKRTKVPTKKQQKNIDEFNKALFGGEE